MKKEKFNIVGVIAFFILGIIMFVMSCGDIKYIFTGKADDINEMIAAGEEPEVRDVVSIRIQYAFDWYAESIGQKNTLLCYAALDNGKIISIEVKKYSHEHEKLDDLINSTNYYLEGGTNVPPTPVTLTGVVQNFDSKKVVDYYKKGLRLMGFDTSSDAYMLNIDTRQKRIYFILTLILSIIIIFVTVAIIIAECRMGIKKKSAQDDIEVIRPENDPIFNHAFYDLHRPGNRENEEQKNEKPEDEINSKYKLVSDSNVTDKIVDSGESIGYSDNDEPVVKQSKFTLKKD